jgi:phage tail sheath protein FI
MTTYRTPGVYLEEVFHAPPRTLATGVPAFVGFAARGPVAVPAAFESWARLLELLRRRESLTSTERAALDAAGRRARLDVWPSPHAAAPWSESVAAALAAALWPPLERLLRVDRWADFDARFGGDVDGSYLADAVRGFFDNGGESCYVLRLPPDVAPLDAVGTALAALDHLDDVDVVCAPDPAQPPLTGDKQHLVLAYCETSGRLFAILDSLPGAGVETVLAQRSTLLGANAALYYPWIAVRRGRGEERRLVPPCGHVAGVYSRSDRLFGVHKAPANEVLEGVLDLETPVGTDEQAQLNDAGVNAVRVFRGRGIRVWGARTVSREPAWRYVNVRRIFLTAARWIELTLADAPFEPNDPALWARIRLTLSRYFTDLFRRGALKGASADEAFYVRCDADTNRPEDRDAGRVVVEIGLAPVLPHEFVVVHITRSAGGVTITGPVRG